MQTSMTFQARDISVLFSPAHKLVQHFQKPTSLHSTYYRLNAQHQWAELISTIISALVYISCWLMHAEIRVFRMLYFSTEIHSVTATTIWNRELSLQSFNLIQKSFYVIRDISFVGRILEQALCT